jgi:hypothetical protein
MAGHWKLLPDSSSSIDPWRNLSLAIRLRQDTVVIIKTYSASSHDVRKDSMEVNTRGEEQTVSIPSGRWLGQVSMGVYYGASSFRHLTAQWNEEKNQLRIDGREVLETSQGEIQVRSSQTLSISPDRSTLTITETRSTRAAPPMGYKFVRLTE